MLVPLEHGLETACVINDAQVILIVIVTVTVMMIVISTVSN